MQRLLVCTTCWAGLVAGAVSAAFSGSVDAAQASSPAPPKPRVVCGMTLVPMGNPSVDPGIAEGRLRSPMRFTIRAIEPPICW
jgi:hypothetical protein